MLKHAKAKLHVKMQIHVGCGVRMTHEIRGIAIPAIAAEQPRNPASPIFETPNLKQKNLMSEIS
jgi:hypothetical protein